MSFWSAETLRERLHKTPIIEPTNKDRIKYGAYELSLGEEAYVSSKQNDKKQKLKEGEHFNIPQGQICILHTKEWINIPNDAMAFISIKAGLKLLGLINISGFHVDPGYSGELRFSVYNAGGKTIRLECGAPTFLIWFSELTNKTKDVYNGNHKNQKGVSPKAIMDIAGDIASPQFLLQKINQLDQKIESNNTILWKIFIPLTLILLSILITLIVQNDKTPKASHIPQSNSIEFPFHYPLEIDSPKTNAPSNIESSKQTEDVKSEQ